MRGPERPGLMAFKTLAASPEFYKEPLALDSRWLSSKYHNKGKKTRANRRQRLRNKVCELLIETCEEEMWSLDLTFGDFSVESSKFLRLSIDWKQWYLQSYQKLLPPTGKNGEKNKI